MSTLDQREFCPNLYFNAHILEIKKANRHFNRVVHGLRRKKGSADPTRGLETHETSHLLVGSSLGVIGLYALPKASNCLEETLIS